MKSPEKTTSSALRHPFSPVAACVLPFRPLRWRGDFPGGRRHRTVVKPIIPHDDLALFSCVWDGFCSNGVILEKGATKRSAE